MARAARGIALCRYFLRDRGVGACRFSRRTMLVYYANELRDLGMPEADVREADALRRDVWSYLFTGKEYEKARRELNDARRKRWFAEVNSQQDRLFDQLQKPSELDHPGSAILSFRREMTYNPLPLSSVTRAGAVLVRGRGSPDSVEKSAAVIREVLTQSVHADFTIEVFDHDNHGMHNAGGSVDPRYLDAMREWLTERVRTDH